MNTSATAPPMAATADKDLAEQARPGHGVPSQDPDPAAQRPLEPGEAEREAHSVLVGGGVMVGAATGAAVGTAVAGPVGTLVGGTLGAVAGALGGAVAGSAMNPADAPADPVPPVPLPEASATASTDRPAKNASDSQRRPAS